MSAQTTSLKARFVHVNLPLDEAIALHRAASGRDEEWLTLQTILFAAAPTVDDLRQQLDYVTALPAAVWARPGADTEATREAWLRGISRCLTWIVSEAAASQSDSNAVRAE